MNETLGGIDLAILISYGIILIGMGWYFTRKTKTAEAFMVASRSIPAWAAGLAVMSAYTSSISYIATPGKAFDDNWHPLVFALCIIPIAWLVTKYVIPFYRKNQTISVYKFLENRLGIWARVYAAFAFVFFMIGRVAVILYLASLLLGSFMDFSIVYIIIILGVVTILYTLMGGMEAVIWTDVMQSVIMIVGILYCAISLSIDIFQGENSLVSQVDITGKFSLGSADFSFSSRTLWVMIIYGITENARNLIADQNYVQKYSSVGSEKEAKNSIWLAMVIYIFLTIIFLYIGTALWIYYNGEMNALPADIVKGDQIFPYFIATVVPVGLKGLIIAAIIAAAMSTVDSALNCSATVLHLDFYKRFFKPEMSNDQEMSFLRWSTVVWGVLGTLFALAMINAKSALDIWWQISGIFGGGILGLFLLALSKIKLSFIQGLSCVGVCILVIIWGTFVRDLTGSLEWMNCTIDPILVGALATFWMVAMALVMGKLNKSKPEQVISQI
ncbi:sodium:solute symporter family transporter [Flexithrix dorotheae]|uniref:sodium:solute symporter family transporter n=1 Tax=Flexithrix dorotheae TaxID=70993 RepID=UPI000372ACB3|nr:sodium/solute symporter [Flexithrix dorotheae]